MAISLSIQQHGASPEASAAASTAQNPLPECTWLSVPLALLQGGLGAGDRGGLADIQEDDDDGEYAQPALW